MPGFASSFGIAAPSSNKPRDDFAQRAPIVGVFDVPTMLRDAIGLAAKLIPIRVCLSSAHVARLRSPTNVAQEHPDMSANRFNNSDKRTNSAEVIDMTAVAEASRRLREIAEPVPAGDTVKGAINRATRAVAKHLAPHFHARWHAGRAEDIWRGEARGVWAEEMDAIRAAADAKAVEEARNELQEFDARLARLEALLVSDEGFNRPQVDAYRAAARRPDRPLD